MRWMVGVIAVATIAGCGADKQYDNVSANGEVETPAAPVEHKPDIPPHMKYKNVQEACPPLPVKDGFVTVKMKVEGGGYVTLRLPEYADIRRHPAMYGECGYATDIFIRYVWFKNQLIPGWDARSEIPADKNRRVHIGLQPEATYLLKNRKAFDSWRYSPAIPHKFLPLEYYPRSRWEAEAGPRYRSSSKGTWGVLRTKHRDVDGRPFPAGCTIDTSNINFGHKNVVIETDLVEDASSRCTGGVAIETQGKVLGTRIDVYKDAVPEINHIYDAVYKEVQNFVQ